MSCEPMAVRTTGRIKKPKLVFDPSDYDTPRLKNTSHGLNHSTASGSSLGTTHSHQNADRGTHGSAESKKNQRSPGATSVTSEISNDTCCICCKKEAKRGIHSRNKMIHCQQCENKAHRLCLTIDFEDLELLMKNYKCHQCRVCAICLNKTSTSSNPLAEYMTCSKCVRSFHLSCHKPPIDELIAYSKNWRCKDCIEPKIETIHKIIGTNDQKNTNQLKSIPQTPKHTNSSSKSINQNKKVNTSPPSVPIGNRQDNFNKIPNDTSSSSSHAEKIQLKNEQNQNRNQNRESSVTKEQKLRKMPPLTSLSSKQNRPFSGTPIVSSSEGPSELLIDFDVKNSRSSASSPKKNGEISSLSPTSSTNYNALDPIDIPSNIKFWNSEQVMEYFAKYFPKEAYIFKEQEIDGMALLLLKRSDIVKKLPIKLGPALKIYNLILKLQAQLNDPTLGWNIGQ